MNNFFWNTKSRSLKSLSPEKKTEIIKYLSDPQERKKRHCEQKYRLEHGGQSLVVFSLQDGVGSERGSTRVLYTYWEQKYILLDYVLAHDYHKAPSMDRGFMTSWFGQLKEGTAHIEPLEAAVEPELIDCDKEVATESFLPIGFNHDGGFIVPSERQQHVVSSNSFMYPAIIEGPAGSGKTFILSMLCEVLSQEQSEKIQGVEISKKKKALYLYPQKANLLGIKMAKYWEETYLTGTDSFPCDWVFETKCLDDLLPESLNSESFKKLSKEVISLMESKKNQLKIYKKDPKSNEHNKLIKAWAILEEAKVDADLLTQYLISLAVFQTYLPGVLLKDLFSSRDGLSSDIFEAFERIYKEEIALGDWFKPLTQALENSEQELFDCVMVDEAQNVSFAALAYLVFHTREHRVIYVGDRDQSDHWASISSLQLINRLLQQRGLINKNNHKKLEEHYRCPPEVWDYTQSILIPFKEQLFGHEYQRSMSPIFPQITQGQALSYLRVCEKNKAILQDFFQSIPEMTPDCFVVTSNPQDFEEFSSHYLSGKKLIVLTPEQIAGLEAKVVVALDSLNFGLMRNIERVEKVKGRITKLQQEEEAVYQQLNLLYVTVTRSTEKVLILETKNNSHYSAQVRLFSHLKPPIISSEHKYVQSSPHELLAIYNQIMTTNKAAAEEFFNRYGNIFSSLLKPQTEEEIFIEPEHIPITEILPEQPKEILQDKVSPLIDIQKRIEVLGKRTSDWDKLQDLSAFSIAELLFTPYGKSKRTTKTLFERVVEHSQKNSKTLTTEQNVWKKFLESNAYKKYIDENFFQLQMPAESGLTIKEWLDNCPKDTAHDALKKQLFSALALDQTSALDSIETMEKSTIQRSRSDDKNIENNNISDNLQSILKISEEISRYIAISPIKSEDDFMLQALKMEFIDRQSMNNVPKCDALKKLDDLIYNRCTKHPLFWKTLTASKYHALRNLTENRLLLLRPGAFSLFEFDNQEEEPCLRSLNINIFQDANIYIKQWVRSVADKKQLCLTEVVRGMFEVLKYYSNETCMYHKYSSKMPLLVVLYKIDSELIEGANPSVIQQLLSKDPFWKNKEIESDLVRVCADIMTSSKCENLNFIRMMIMAVKKNNIQLNSVLEKVRDNVQSQFIHNVIYNTASELDCNKNYFLKYLINFQQVGLYNHITEIIIRNCITNYTFWTNMTKEKYFLLQQITNNKKLFWRAPETTSTSHNLSFDPILLRAAMGGVAKKITSLSEFYEAIKGFSYVLESYQNSIYLTSENPAKYAAPIILLVWRICPQLLNLATIDSLFLLLEDDAFWLKNRGSNVLRFIKEVEESIGMPNSQKMLHSLNRLCCDYRDLNLLENNAHEEIELPSSSALILSKTVEKSDTKSVIREP